MTRCIVTLNKCALIRLCVCVVGVFVVSINSLCLDVDLLSIVGKIQRTYFTCFPDIYSIYSKVKKKKLPAKGIGR